MAIEAHETQAREHGPQFACYARDGSGLRPFIQCLCGTSFRGDTWADVGQEFDDHLADIEDDDDG